MTAIVGILCSDGVVIGSDSSATFAAHPTVRTIEQKVKKIEIIEDSLIVAGTGQIGCGQRFCNIVKKCYDGKIFSHKEHIEIGTHLCSETRKDFGSTGLQHDQYGSLLAFSKGEKFYLCEFATHDFQPEFKTKSMWFVSMGSGQPITDPFLGLMRKVFWGDNLPNVSTATFVATWTLLHAIELNTGGIQGPVQMSVLHKDKSGKFKATILSEEELQQHIESATAAETHLGDFKNILLGNTATPSPIVTPHDTNSK